MKYRAEGRVSRIDAGELRQMVEDALRSLRRMARSPSRQVIRDAVKIWDDQIVSLVAAILVVGRVSLGGQYSEIGVAEEAWDLYEAVVREGIKRGWTDVEEAEGEGGGSAGRVQGPGGVSEEGPHA